MKMTDESALLAIVHAIDDLHEAFAPTVELRRARDYLRARLAADQQKSGGCNCEVSAGLAAFHKDDCRSMAPQPSIPAPAQQDGKAGGGAVAWLRAKADEQDANNARWPEHAKCYPQWQLMPVIARQLAAQLELAHPPHADQETQG